MHTSEHFVHVLCVTYVNFDYAAWAFNAHSHVSLATPEPDTQGPGQGDADPARSDDDRQNLGQPSELIRGLRARYQFNPLPERPVPSKPIQHRSDVCTGGRPDYRDG
jgi:hypothetical protein